MMSTYVQRARGASVSDVYVQRARGASVDSLSARGASVD